jgi:hypothetical protein
MDHVREIADLKVNKRLRAPLCEEPDLPFRLFPIEHL